MAWIAFGEGDLQREAQAYQQMLALAREMGDKDGMGFAFTGLGILMLRQGNDEAAQPLFAESLSLFREVGNKAISAWPLIGQGLVAVRQGDYAQARTLLKDSLVIDRITGIKVLLIESLRGLADLAVAEATRGGRQDKGLKAARLYGAAEALAEAVGPNAVLRIMQAIHDQSLTALRDQLDPATLEAAWTEGRAMEQAVAYALAESDHPGSDHLTEG
jgi:tetratricopeptide (TPR) repeat protein